MDDQSASSQIDGIIEKHGGWKGDVLRQLRRLINAADPSITEEVKWKTKSRPEGLPVWTFNGIVCFAEIWKDNVKLIFFRGAELLDPNKLFNSRLKSSTLRAIEFREGDSVDETGIKALVVEAIETNINKGRR